MTDERRRPSTVVTSQNLEAYQAKEFERLAPLPVNPAEGMLTAEPEKTEIAKTEPEAKSTTDGEKPDEKQEQAKAKEEPKKAETDKDEDEIKKKEKFSKRVHELSETVKAEKAKREEAERRISELEAQLKPKVEKTEEMPKPKKEEFTDPDQYAEKLAEWTVAKAMRERDQQEEKARSKAHQDRIQTTWQERIAAIQKEVPDFAEKIQASKNVFFSDEIRDEIFESEVGPRILLHYADHPEEATKLGRMSLPRAYIALGKLEAILNAPPKASVKEEPTDEPEEKVVKPIKQVEISKAPAPISPLKGANAPIDLPMIDGVWKGTHEQYREARKSGKIK